MKGSTQHRVVFSCRDGHTECKDVLIEAKEPSEADIVEALHKQHDIAGASVTRFYPVPLRRVLDGKAVRV